MVSFQQVIVRQWLAMGVFVGEEGVCQIERAIFQYKDIQLNLIKEMLLVVERISCTEIGYKIFVILNEPLSFKVLKLLIEERHALIHSQLLKKQ